MKPIIGISLEKIPFSMDEFVGVLLYHEFPVTAIFSDESGQPIIRRWVDCDNNIDRYFIYKTSRENLKRFLDTKINQQDFVLECDNNIGVIIDQKPDEILSIKIVSPNSLPNDYLPSIDSFFNEEDGVDTKKIIDFFALDTIEIQNANFDEELMSLAQSKRSEIFNLHLKKGNGVGRGRIESVLYGTSLITFANLYKEIGLDCHLGKNRGGKDAKVIPLGGSISTEVIIQRAASFSVFIKPKNTYQLNAFDDNVSNENIAMNLFNLLKISSEDESLKNEYLKYSDFVFKAFKEFLASIIRNEMLIDVNWVNEVGSSLIKDTLTVIRANDTLERIKKIDAQEIISITQRGKFVSISIPYKSFTFISLQNEKFNGRFDTPLHGNIDTLTFNHIYEVVISREIIKEMGSSDMKIKDTLMAFYIPED